ncbi:uncharacterized protein LOC119580072 [Penaeus monodon]|uniref:uncharacterized protein LOC119580072 n=1 Tax=Penaeus monodon TaxID=6687 RepID=UPI0018A77503|nr:uncharacterized protein LOC119580072 [Penaeus monodon]
MDGYGTLAWCRLVLLCSFQAALAAGLPREQGSQCPVFSPGHDLGGRFPLYVGIFPEEENWKWEMEFKNNESKTFLRFDLQSGNEKITAQLTSGLYSEIQSSEVKWSEDAFPLREWSYLAVYADGDHVVVPQRQDAGAAAVRLSLDKPASTWFRIASNGNVTLNCMDGHDITSVSELLQVSEDKTYCLQAAGPPVSLPDGNTPLTVTNATWHPIQGQTANYSVSGVIFVMENCSANAFMSTTLTTGISTTTSEEATTTPTTDLTSPTTHQAEQSESSLLPTTPSRPQDAERPSYLTSPTTHQPEQSESSFLPTTPSRPQDAETEGPSYTSRFSSTPTLNADNAGTSTPGEKRTEPLSKEHSQGPSTGAVAAVVITSIILLLTVTFLIKKGFHREVIMLWHNAFPREEEPVQILTLQKGSSPKQKENNE